MKWTISIPGWHPSSLNRLLRCRWEAHRRKKEDRRTVSLYLLRAGVQPVAPPRSVVRQARRAGIELIWDQLQPRRRRLAVEVLLARGERDSLGRYQRLGMQYDPDNLIKSLLDALSEGGWIVDDSPDWLESSLPVQRRADQPGTILTLEDLD